MGVYVSGNRECISKGEEPVRTVTIVFPIGLNTRITSFATFFCFNTATWNYIRLLTYTFQGIGTKYEVKRVTFKGEKSFSSANIKVVSQWLILL